MNNITKIENAATLNKEYNDIYNFYAEGTEENPIILPNSSFEVIRDNHNRVIGGKAKKCYFKIAGISVVTERKYTFYKGGKVIKTNYLHIFTPNSHYRETTKGTFRPM